MQPLLTPELLLPGESHTSLHVSSVTRLCHVVAESEGILGCMWSPSSHYPLAASHVVAVIHAGRLTSASWKVTLPLRRPPSLPRMQTNTAVSAGLQQSSRWHWLQHCSLLLGLKLEALPPELGFSSALVRCTAPAPAAAAGAVLDSAILRRPCTM